MAITAVIFDLGGVVFDSPLAAVAAFERDIGLADQTLNRAIVGAGSGGAWARLERGELSMAEFFVAFEAELLALEIAISAEALMARMADSTQLRPAMVSAIRTIRGAGLKVAALTNNWVSDDQHSKMGMLRAEFDVFVESCRVGLRKPDPRIYELACRELGVPPQQAAFLDDIGSNLKAARALGMTTIKVEDAPSALARLGELLRLPLTAPQASL